MSEPCLFFIYLMAALFVSTAFGIVSTLTMLGFSVVQYLAVRRVTHPSVGNTAGRVSVFIVLAWTFSLLGGIAPFTVMLIVARHRPCGPGLRRLIGLVFLYGVDACVTFVTVIYVAIFHRRHRPTLTHDPSQRDLRVTSERPLRSRLSSPPVTSQSSFSALRRYLVFNCCDFQSKGSR